MIQLFKILIEAAIISFVCIGLKVCYAEGMVFSFVGKWLMKLWNKRGWENIAKPLGACHYCMASVYGVFIHVYLVKLGCAGSTALLPVTLLVVVVLNGILYGVLNKLDPGLW